MAHTYYRITTTREPEMAGAGLGYDEMYGGWPRYFWTPEAANMVLGHLNGEGDWDKRGPDDLVGTYRIEERRVYPDGRYDDEYDPCAREQLGIEDPRS
jgi:hypothetical protein